MELGWHIQLPPLNPWRDHSHFDIASFHVSSQMLLECVLYGYTVLLHP